MEIQYKGHSHFILRSENNTTVSTDPYPQTDQKKGEPAQIVTISHNTSNHNALQNILGDPQIIDWPGEYEIQGVAITGISANNVKTGEENIIFKYLVDQIRICHLGDLNLKLTDKILDKIGNVDILMIPVGGANSLNATQAKDLIEEIDPRIILPMHYQMNENDVDLAPVENFLKTMGKSDLEKQDKLSLTKSQLPTDKSEIIVLEVN